MSNDIKMSVCLQDLSAYNLGYLSYKWVDLPISNEELGATLQEIGVDGVMHEEYMIADYDSDLPLCKEYGEFAGVEELNELAKRVQELDEDQARALVVASEVVGLTEELDAVEDYAYVMHQDAVTMADVAYEHIRECYDLDAMGPLAAYIDYEAFGRDLDIEGTYIHCDDGILELTAA